jgi:hypothetical protein
MLISEIPVGTIFTLENDDGEQLTQHVDDKHAKRSVFLKAYEMVVCLNDASCTWVEKDINYRPYNVSILRNN